VAIGDNGNAGPAEIIPAGIPGTRTSFRVSDPTSSAFFWLTGFFIVYCTRFEDFIPGMQYIPMAKITAIMAMWGLFNALGKTKRTFKDLPKMANLLLYMVILLYIGAFLSPIWRGGAVKRTTDFSKIYVVWVLVFLIITTFPRLKRIIFIQAFSVVMICIAAIIKGYGVPRLDQVLGGALCAGFYGAGEKWHGEGVLDFRDVDHVDRHFPDRVPGRLHRFDLLLQHCALLHRGQGKALLPGCGQCSVRGPDHGNGWGETLRSV
jgi:hypothetical protein